MGERARISWLGSYPQGMRWDAELATGPVSQLLDRTAEAFPDNPAIDFLGHKLNYRQLDELVSRAACGLQQLGVGPGVHVGLFLPNTPHYFIGFLGVLRAGGTVVNYSPLDAERTLAHKIEDSETDIMLTLDLASLYPRMAGLVGTTRLRHVVVGQLTEFCGPVSAAAAGQLGPSVPVAMDAQTLSFASLLDNDGDYRAHPQGDPASSLAVLQYTGGTTGVPKGAMLTHANITDR